MKFIKKYFKVTICFMAFAICSLLMAFGPATSAVYAVLDKTANTYNLEMNAIHMPKSTVDASAGEELEIPLINKGEFSSYKIKVEDPSKKVYTYEGTDTAYFTKVVANNTVKVNYLADGTYKIMYVMVDGDGEEYYSNSYSVTVTNAKYELSFTNATTGKVELVRTKYKTNDTVTLPIPQANSEDATVTVIHNNTTVSLTTASGYKTFVPTEEGTYTVKYLYAHGNRPSASYTITVADDFTAPVADDIKLMNDITMPTVKLGQTDITLPKLSLKRGDEENISYNLTSLKLVNSANSDIYQELNTGDNCNNYEFDFTVDAFEGVTSYTGSFAGEYKVIYTVVDEYGLEHQETFKLNVTTAEDPEVYLAYDYTAGGTVNKDAEYDLKAKYNKNEIILPAIYGEDPLNDDSLIYVRYIRHVDTDTIFYVDNKVLNKSTYELEDVSTDNAKRKNTSSDANIGDYTKAVEFKFDDEGYLAGDYVLEYQAISKVYGVRQSVKTSYTFTVVDGTVTSTTPTIKLNNSTKNVDGGETVDVTVTATDTADSRLKTKVFSFTTGSVANLETNLNDVVLALGTDKTSNVLDNAQFVTMMQGKGYTDFTVATYDEDTEKYSITASTTANTNIVAVTINDFAKIAVATDTLTLRETSETVAPTYTIDTSVASSLYTGTTPVTTPFTQKDTITLPKVDFTDTDSTLEMRVSYYVDSPVGENGINFKYPQSWVPGANSISGVKIKATEAGTYHVCYTAIDDARNVTAVYFTFEVVESTQPTLNVNVDSSISRSGNTLTVETGTTVAFDAYLSYGNTIYDDTVSITSIDYDGTEYACYPSGDANSFIFDGVGTYTLTFHGEHASVAAVDKVIIVNVTRPTLAFEDDYASLVNSYISNEVYEKDSVVKLPVLSANNNAGVQVTVKNSSGTELAVTREYDSTLDVDVYKFTVDADTTTYSIVYTATMADGSTKTSETFTLKVGDAVAPVVKMDEAVKAELEGDITYDGENQINYVITKSNKTLTIKVTSNGTEIYSKDLGLTITDKDNKGSTSNTTAWNNLKYTLTGDSVSGSDGNYVISGTGEYTLKISTTDSNDNDSNTITIEFNVVTESEADENKDTVVGIVLIVISLVVLVGVILFFLLTDRKARGKKVKSTKAPKNVKSKEAEEVETTEEVEETKTVEETEEKVEEVEEQPEATEVAEGTSTEDDSTKTE